MQPLTRIRSHALFGAAIALACVGGFAGPARAHDSSFFESVLGTWTGPGRVVAGKYKGTRFTCALTGDPLKSGKTGVAMDGHCRVGVFSQDMSAVISKTKSGYAGHFLDGAKGKGLDVVSGDIIGNKVVVGITRKQLFGAMVADLVAPDTLNVTISVKVDAHYVPVIGMTLKRDRDAMSVGSIK